MQELWETFQPVFFTQNPNYCCNFRFPKRGVQWKCKQRVLATPFCKWVCNTTWICSDSKQLHRCAPSTWTLACSSTAAISRTSRTNVARGGSTPRRVRDLVWLCSRWPFLPATSCSSRTWTPTCSGFLTKPTATISSPACGPLAGDTRTRSCTHTDCREPDTLTPKSTSTLTM